MNPENYNNVRRIALGLVWILLVAGVAFRFSGVMYGLPQNVDPDERVFVAGAGEMLSGRSLDPGWYGSPASTLMDLLAASFAGIAVAGVVSGQLDSVAELKTLYFDDPTVLYASGRFITGMAGVLCLLVVYRLARRFMSDGFALLATTLVALSPLTIQYAAIIRMDGLQVIFMLLVAYYSVRLLDGDRGQGKNFVLAGVCLGLAVTSKYPGVIAVIAILAAVAMSSSLDFRARIRGLAVAAVASLVAAFISGPYLFLNFSGMLSDVLNEARGRHLSATSDGFWSAITDYLFIVLPEDMGWLFTSLAYVGLVSMLLRPGKARLLALLFFAYVVFISSLNLFWERWALPLIPFAAIASAYVVEGLWGWGRQRGWQPAPSLGVAIVVMLVGMSPAIWSASVAAAQRVTNTHAKVVALEWVRGNIPTGSRILLETYTPQLRVDEYEVFHARGPSIELWRDHSRHLRPDSFFGSIGGEFQNGTVAELRKAVRELEIEYLMLSGFRQRYAREDFAKAAHIVALYDGLVRDATLLAEFDDVGLPGSPIRIYRLAPE